MASLVNYFIRYPVYRGLYPTMRPPPSSARSCYSRCSKYYTIYYGAMRSENPRGVDAFAAVDNGTGGGTFLGHPHGLFLLFFLEMWERFSYYGMRAILIFYLAKHFLFGKDHSYAVYGAYTSLVYITPVIGGYLADR